MTVLLALLLLVVLVLAFGYLCALFVLARDAKSTAEQLRSTVVELRSAAYLVSQSVRD